MNSNDAKDSHKGKPQTTKAKGAVKRSPLKGSKDAVSRRTKRQTKPIKNKNAEFEYDTTTKKQQAAAVPSQRMHAWSLFFIGKLTCIRNC